MSKKFKVGDYFIDWEGDIGIILEVNPTKYDWVKIRGELIDDRVPFIAGERALEEWTILTDEQKALLL